MVDETEPVEELEVLEFEGEVVLEVENKVKGTKLLANIGQKHRGDRVVMVLEAEVDGITHEKSGDGVRRVQRFDVLAAYALVEENGRDILRTERARYRLADDEAHGRTSLPFDDTQVPAQYVAAGGVVMLAAEIAELRGEVYNDEATLSVEFADGTKALWPDDWAGTGQSLAPVGGMMRPPTCEPGQRFQVVRHVDAETGETVAEWSAEDEEVRLLVEEQNADFAEDLDAVDELEAARRRKADPSIEALAAADLEEELTDDDLDDGAEELLSPDEEADIRAEAAEALAEPFPGTPWEGYASSKISDIKNRVRETDDTDVLAHAAACERRTHNRPTVLKAILVRLNELEAPPVEDGDEVDTGDLGLSLTIDGAE